MKNVALIPARSGSKRLPQKNISDLNGIPLIAHTILACKGIFCLDRIIVSTDDQKIACIAKEYGAEVPFLRPSKISGDGSTDREVMLHLIHWLRDKENYFFDNLLYMRPTTPFKTKAKIKEAIEKIGDQKYSGIRSITRVHGIHHPYWTFKKENGFLKSFLPQVKIENFFQSQLLPECFRLNGVIDIARVDTIQSQNNIYGNSIGFIEVDELHSVDIDTELELLFCKFLIEKGIL